MLQQQKVHDMLRQSMQEISRRKAYFTASSQVLLSLMTAPFITLSTSLQLSNSNQAVTMQNFRKEQSISRAFQARILGKQGGATLSPSARFGFLNMFKRGEVDGKQLTQAQKAA
mmetsp:Transcript_15732/g.26538  ORF Transcript_15732/g.26538 Transcript_15732/m.26538 type:complete len:114 (+) Transcript_15732:227-568(+)